MFVSVKRTVAFFKSDYENFIFAHGGQSTTSKYTEHKARRVEARRVEARRANARSVKEAAE